jgi:DNA-binding NtrC family response regulator
MALLEQGAYESNVRELENIVRNTLVGLKGNVISAGDLEMKRAEATESAVGILTDDSLFDALFQEIARRQPLPPGFDSFDIIERKLVIRALEQCEGNQSRVAKFLGITRNTLRKRIAKYGLKIGGKRVHDEGEP